MVIDLMNKAKNRCGRCESTEGTRTIMVLKSKVKVGSITSTVCDQCKEKLTRLGWEEKLVIFTTKDTKEKVPAAKEEKRIVDYAEMARRTKVSQRHWGGA